MPWGDALAFLCTALLQPPAVIYDMAWPDAVELWRWWERYPPPHVSLHHLAVGMGCMLSPGPARELSAPEDLDRLLGE